MAKEKKRGDKIRQAGKKVREGAEVVAEGVRDAVGRVADAARGLTGRARDALERLRAQRRVTGVHAAGTPEAAKAAREYGLGDRPLLEPRCRASVAWRREGRDDFAAIFYDAALETSPQRLTETLETAVGLAEDLVDRERIVAETLAWLRKANATPRDLDIDAGGAPDDEEQAGEDHGLASVPDDEPVFARMRPLRPAEIEIAQEVYGDSLDFDRIYMGAVNGLLDSPFTPSWPGGRFRSAPKPFGEGMWGSVLCMGARLFREGIPATGDSPGRREARHAFVHEMAHAWQCQHHFNPAKYMYNAIASMYVGAKSFSLLGPTLAYFYLPGRPFHRYSAEQVATQAQNWFRSDRASRPDLAATVAHMRNVPKGRVDPYLVIGLLRNRIRPPRPPFEGPPAPQKPPESLIRD